MFAELSCALERVAPTARKRLERCVPKLQEAMATWDGTMPRGGLLLACSTPRAGVLLRTAGWPAFDTQAAAKFDRGDAALALVDAIESQPSSDRADLVIASSFVLLGARGIKQHGEDVAKIMQRGHLPLTILLAEQNGCGVTMVATVVALEAATLH